MIETLYGLRNIRTGEICGYSAADMGDAEFCISVSYSLEEQSYDGRLWLVKDKLNAEYVRRFSTPYYNASYETPELPKKWNPDNYEVIEINLVENCKKIKVDFPSCSEMIEFKLRFESTEKSKEAYRKSWKRDKPQFSYCDYSEYSRKKLNREK